MRPLRTLALVLALLAAPLLALSGAQANGNMGLKPLSAKAKKAIHGFRSDTPVERSRHYVKTNENRHDHFIPFIKGLRGGYIGIASDQSYTLMAYARSQYGFLIDYDSMIQDLHRVHRGLILSSSTAKLFLSYWSKAKKKAALAILKKAYPKDPLRKKVLRAYRLSQRRLDKYLNKRAKSPPKTRPNWLNTPKYYKYIRRMYQLDRIRIVYGNLVGSRTLVGIGKAAKSLGIPIRVFYTSNAEEWIGFREAYRRNINALYVDQKSVMCRTLWIKLFQPRTTDLWQYNIQKLVQFQKMLKKGNSWVGGLNRYMQLSHLWGVTLIGYPIGYTP